MPTKRGSRIAYDTAASNSVTITLPTGTVAGDSCLAFDGNGWDVAVSGGFPAGFDAIDLSAGSFFNGATAFKAQLSAADIATGSVTITHTNGYFGVAALVTFVGQVDIRTENDFRNGSGSTARSLATDSSPVSGDLGVWFSACRGNTAVTCDRGAQIETTSNSEGSGVVNIETMAGGTVTGNFAYGAAGSGDYGVVAVVSDLVAGLRVTKAEVLNWLSPPDGFDASKVEALGWLAPPPGFDVSKAEALLWLAPGTITPDPGAGPTRRRGQILGG